MSDTASVDALAMVIARTTQAIETAGPHDRVPWLFARCWMRATRYETIAKNPVDIDAALDDFDDLPADLPGRAKLAAVLATALIRSGELVGSARMPRAMALVDIADTDPSPLADWPATSAALRAMDLLLAWQQNRPGFSPRAALRELERYTRIVGDTQPQATMVDAARRGLQHLVVQDDMDPSAARRLAEDARAFADGLDPRSPMFDRGAMMALLQEASARAMRGDHAGAMERLEQVRAGSLRLPVGDPLRRAVDEAWNQIAPFLQMLQPDGTGGGPAHRTQFVNPAGRGPAARLRSDGRPGRDPGQRTRPQAVPARPRRTGRGHPAVGGQRGAPPHRHAVDRLRARPATHVLPDVRRGRAPAQGREDR
ncbi:hypothetical protein [Streptomyces canus]